MKRLIETILSKIQRREPCFDIYPYYGKAPHKHFIDPERKIFSTMMKPREEWPENFVEDGDGGGCGMWFCPDKKCRAKCGGRL